MMPGTKVRTTKAWGKRYSNGRTYYGTLRAIIDTGSMTHATNIARTHVVALKPGQTGIAEKFDVLRFAPEDIEEDK
jgi:hypothetical protein